MSQQTFVYRGVQYTKAVSQPQTQTTQTREAGKVYRGVGFVKSPRAQVSVLDHTYRGSHYAAAC